MAKISPVSIKYIIRAKFSADGVVEKPDVIGAIFGQTEGLLGEELELRELQKEGKIGRIEVQIESEKGRTEGIIEIPTSIDKAETALIAAALETIERVGPCDATIKVEKIEDVRTIKREYVVERAKSILKEFQDEGPESAELTSAITQTVRMMEIKEYGRERLPAGPEIEENSEIVVVEGRADVLNLLRHGIKNGIAMNGTSVPETIKELSRMKEVTLFVDGDRGGDLITKDVIANCRVKFIARAPAGKEVEELTKKELLKALRDKEEVKSSRREEKESRVDSMRGRYEHGEYREHKSMRERNEGRERYDRERERDRDREPEMRNRARVRVSSQEREIFVKLIEELTGTRGAYILDEEYNILGKVPLSELSSVLQKVKAYGIIADGTIDEGAIRSADRTGVSFIVASNFYGRSINVKLITARDVLEERF